MNIRSIFPKGLIVVFSIWVSSLHAAISPADLYFTRQASKRMIFDQDQALPLSALEPRKVIGLEVMHPVRKSGEVKVTCVAGKLRMQGAVGSEASVWFSGFNPFATYQLEIAACDKASVGLEFVHAGGEILRIETDCGKAGIENVRWLLERGRETLLKGEADNFRTRSLEEPVTLKVQMVAVGFNVYLKQRGVVELIGRADIASHLDIRKKEVFQNMSTWVHVAAGDEGVNAAINRASADLSPGIGQADIRAITDEGGTPLLDGGRLWFTASARGGGLPHPAQGVFSLDPGIFDPRFEGLIVFDRGDGLLRNELASHLYFDRPSGEWRGWTTGFSAFGDPAKKEQKEILAVRSGKDPRRGFSVMSAAAMGLVGDYEDPQGIFDKASGKWRMLLCQNIGGYKAAVFESGRWNGGFARIAGPVEADSTGTTIQKMDGVPYALFGSADRSFHVCSFPGLEPLGKLDLDLPPWPPSGNSRVWPCLVPLPEGYYAPYALLTFDRANFPGMKGPNWTYGAMYFYHGYPKKR